MKIFDFTTSENVGDFLKIILEQITETFGKNILCIFSFIKSPVIINLFII